MVAADGSDYGPADQGDHREAADVAGGGDHFTAWQEMRERAGPRISLIQLYALVAEPRGLKPNELPLAERRVLAAGTPRSLCAGYQHSATSQPRQPEPVRLVPYTPDWTQRFELWR